MASNPSLPPDTESPTEVQSELIALRPDKAECYRRKAEEVRIVADEVQDATSRQTLNRIAEDYERLASRSDRRQRGRANSPGSRNHR